MAKLVTLKPRLTALASRLSVPAYSEPAQRVRQRDESLAYRKWYKTSRWQKLRMVVLERDLYTCQKTGVLLIGKHRRKDGPPDPNSPVIDHIIPHRGDPVLFWDEKNLQAVSKKYHDSEKQRLEQASLHMRGTWD